MELLDSIKLVQKILSMCVDTNKKNLPSGVIPRNIYQVKQNSYTNNDRSRVSLNLYFQGIDDISNQKYYTIDNLTLDGYDKARDAIFDVADAERDLFADGDVEILFNNIVEAEIENKPKQRSQRELEQLLLV